jgi:hypothetical protein
MKQFSDVEMKIEVITTFNQFLYERYAKDFLKTYNWPYKLNILTEDGFSFESDNVNWIYPTKEHLDFIARNKYRKPQRMSVDGVRFCHKVFAMTDVKLLKGLDYRIFFDADVIFKKPLLEKDLLNLFFEDTESLMSIYRRNGFHLWVESGAIFFNLRNSRCLELLFEWRELYITDEIYDHKTRTDNFFLSKLIDKYEAEGDKFYDLSLNIFDDRGRIHPSPMNLCPKAKEYWKHYKGQSKFKFTKDLYDRD